MKCACKTKLDARNIVKNYKHFLNCESYLKMAPIPKFFKNKIKIQSKKAKQLHIVLAEIFV